MHATKEGAIMHATKEGAMFGLCSFGSMNSLKIWDIHPRNYARD